MVNVANYRPRPGLAVIPPEWEQHHKLTVDGTRTATVEIWSGPADGQEWVYDPVTKTSVRNHGTLLAGGTARIQRILTEDTQPAGEQDLTTRRYLVTLDRNISGDLTILSRVKVIASGDPLIDGRYLSVLDIQSGSLRFERDLICLDNLTP